MPEQYEQKEEKEEDTFNFSPTHVWTLAFPAIGLAWYDGPQLGAGGVDCLADALFQALGGKCGLGIGIWRCHLDGLWTGIYLQSLGAEETLAGPYSSEGEKYSP